MHRRFVSILLLCVMSLHTLFGWGQGTAAICLGGGHNHAHHTDHDDQMFTHETDEVGTVCDGGCAQSHRNPMPAAILVDDHHDHHDHYDHHGHCGCTDVELTFLGHLAIMRDDLTETTMAIPAPGPMLVAAVAPSSTSVRGPPVETWDDHAIRNQLVRLRSTRINV